MPEPGHTRNQLANDESPARDNRSGEQLSGGESSNGANGDGAWKLEAPGFWPTLDLRELWAYRELLFFLTWRNVLVRYKQAVVGVAWAAFQPVIAMVVFGFVFNRVVHVPSGDAPYPVFVFCGLLPWQLFSGGLSRAGTSLVGDADLITKVYFPRLVIPLSSILSGLVDFAISFVVLVVLMAVYKIGVSWNVLWLPAFVLFALATTLAFSLWLSAADVMYRDVQYIIPFLIQMWMFVSPVAYSPTAISGKLAVLYGLNPMAGVIEGFRWALLGEQPPGGLMWASVVGVVILIVGGVFYFRRMERTFGDVV